MVRLLYLAAFFVPLGASTFAVAVGPFQLSPYRACIFIALLCHFLLTGINPKIKCKVNTSGCSLAFMTFWLIYAVITVIWAKDVTAWFRNIYFLFVGIASIGLFSRYLKNIESLKKASFAFEAGILLQGAIGWYEIITRNYLFLDMTEKNARNYLYGTYRIPIAMQHNPNNFATMMFCGAAVAVFLYLNETKKRRRLCSLLAGLNCILLLFLTTSRANMLAVLISVCVFLVVGNKKKIAFLLLMIIVALCLPQTTEYIEKILQFSFNESGGSDSVRLNLIKTGLMYTLDTFGLGVGAGQIEYWLYTYGSPYEIGSIVNVHNWWIELLSDYGFIVFIGYIIFYVKLMLTFKRFGRTTYKAVSKTGIAFFAILVGYIVACISPSSMVSLEWSWVFLAILMAYMSFIEEKTEMFTYDYENVIGCDKHEDISYCTLSRGRISDS